MKKNIETAEMHLVHACSELMAIKIDLPPDEEMHSYVSGLIEDLFRVSNNIRVLEKWNKIRKESNQGDKS